MSTALTIAQIQAILPHRYPFLLIDRVESLDAERVVAVKCVSVNEPFFQGHFPGQPVMPGVLLLEAMAQAGAILAATATGFDPEKQVIFFMGIDKAKFRRQVVPGDQVRFEVVPIRKGSAVWKMRGEAKVDGVLACEAEFLATMAKRDPAPTPAPDPVG